jgi:FtsZ-interacting cell division protein ZipA
LNKLNDLTISLLAIGLGLIVLVILFNWWQERKIRKTAEKQFATPQSDVLMDDFSSDAFEETAVLIDSSTKIKDVVDRFDSQDVHLPDEVEFKIDLGESERDDEVTTQSPNVTVAETHTEAEESFQIADEHPVNSNFLPDAVNKEIDLTAFFFLPTPVNGERLRQFLIGLVNLDKPIFAYGLDASQVWHPLTREQETVEFTKAAYSLQLADRSGAVSAETLQRFQQMVNEIAYELSAQVEWIGTQDPLEYAQSLDAFCLEVDQVVGLHVINGAGGRFTGTKFRGLAESNGLTMKEDGAFYAQSKSGQSLFKVINMENNPFSSEMLKSVALKGVTFQLEIALTESCTETFNSMVLMAKSMGHSLSATLVDDHQRELNDAKIEKIRQQLKLIQVQMTVKGIAPGSPVALRLFV